MSFWEHVELHPRQLGAKEIGRALRSLHDGLAEYPGALPPRSDLLDEIDWLLGALAGEDGMTGLSAQRDRAAEVILAPEAERQPLHGDASLSNLLPTRSGPCWSDLEDVCLGAVSWDVAGLVADARAAHGDAFGAEVLAAYGRDFDPAALERLDQVHGLYGDLWRRYRRRIAATAA
jgi:Ser/Thr protein kinase RdoA (MazF antagonist)